MILSYNHISYRTVFPLYSDAYGSVCCIMIPSQGSLCLGSVQGIGGILLSSHSDDAMLDATLSQSHIVILIFEFLLANPQNCRQWTKCRGSDSKQGQLNALALFYSRHWRSFFILPAQCHFPQLNAIFTRNKQLKFSLVKNHTYLFGRITETCKNTYIRLYLS